MLENPSLGAHIYMYISNNCMHQQLYFHDQCFDKQLVFGSIYVFCNQNKKVYINNSFNTLDATGRYESRATRRTADISANYVMRANTSMRTHARIALLRRVYAFPHNVF